MTDEEFLQAVQVAGGLASSREARTWARAVVAALAELVPDPEARRQFVTQLPGGLKAHVLNRPPRHLLMMDPDAFVQHVGAALGVRAAEAERVVATVWGVLRRAISAGELADFEAKIPADVAAFLRRAA